MKISWKSFFLSFGAAFLLFALVMACTCSNIFRDHLPIPQRSNASDLANKTRDSYESYIFYCNDKTDAELEFAVLVRIDEDKNSFLVTELYGNDLIECQGSLFYIRSLCQEKGIRELSPIFASLTGYEVSSDRVLNARDYLPEAVKDATVRYVDILDILPGVFENTEGFSVSECALVTEVTQDVRMIQIEQSLEAFQILK